MQSFQEWRIEQAIKNGMVEAWYHPTDIANNVGYGLGQVIGRPLGWARSGLAGLAKGVGHGMYYGGGLDQNEPQKPTPDQSQPQPQPQSTSAQPQPQPQPQPQSTSAQPQPKPQQSNQSTQSTPQAQLNLFNSLASRLQAVEKQLQSLSQARVENSC